MEDANDETCLCDTCSTYKNAGDKTFLKLGDGRQLCSDCSSIAVMSQEECNFISQDVFEFFRSRNLQVNENIHILFINNNQMSKMSKCRGIQGETSGFYYPSVTTVNQIYSTYSLPSKIWYLLTRNILPKLTAMCTTQMRREHLSCGVNIEKSLKSFFLGEIILVLSGKPDVEMGEVLAHEMMHAWLCLHAKPWEWELIVVEGICEFICYEWMQQFASKGFKSLHKTSEQVQYTRNKLKNYLAKEIESRDDEVYGQGVINVMRAVKTNGFKYTLDYTIKNGTLPPPEAEGFSFVKSLLSNGVVRSTLASINNFFHYKIATLQYTNT